MKSLKYLLILVLLSSGYLAYLGLSNDNYIIHARSTGSPGGRTNSPTDGSNCTACHGGNALNSGAAVVSITSEALENGYTPGELYTIMAKIVNPGRVKFGFEVTSERASDNGKTGTFIVTDANRNRLTNAHKAITHVSGGTAGQDSNTWYFDWIAPEAGTGTVIFYGAFNATNNNGGNTGDRIYTTSVQFNEKLEPVYGTDVQIACESYTWIDGNTYTESNDSATYTYEGGASNGADSIVTLDLTINYPTNGIDVVEACDSHTWIDGITYTENNNTATHTITNGAANGCDSIVTLNLTVYPSAGANLTEGNLRNFDCGRTLGNPGQYIYALVVEGASGYQFNVSNQALGYNYTTPITRKARWLQLADLPGIQTGTTYDVQVRATAGNGTCDVGEYGNVCQVTTPNTLVPSTKLGKQCGATIPSSSHAVYAGNVEGASSYTFELSNSSLGYSEEKTNGIRYFKLFQYNVLPNTTYDVRVKVTVNGETGDYGKTCQITTPSSLNMEDLASRIHDLGDHLLEPRTKVRDFMQLNIYPNPTTGLMNLTIDNNQMENTIVEVYSLVGKMIYNATISDSVTSIDLSDFEDGIYLVKVKTPVGTEMIKVIKQ